jgi:hypothetical protein
MRRESGHSPCFFSEGLTEMAEVTERDQRERGIMAKRTAMLEGRQTSTKSGVTSTAKKMDSARHGFKSQPASRKAEGAFGLEGKGELRQSGASTAKPGKQAALRGLKKNRT